MAKREPREIAKERVNVALRKLRQVRDAAKELASSERLQIIGAVQEELWALDAAFRAPRDLFDYETPCVRPDPLPQKPPLGVGRADEAMPNLSLNIRPPRTALL